MSERKQHNPDGNTAGAGVESLAQLSQWQLIRRRFARHKVAVAALNVLIVLYLVAAFVEFFASRDLPFEPAWLTNRSDYAAFSSAGVPVSGSYMRSLPVT